MQTKVGVTGGIGSGKSFVCNILRRRGVPVYDCDAEAKRLMIENIEVRRNIVNLVGKDAYITDNDSGCVRLNKPVIAAYLFADESHAKAINAVVHPAVKENFGRWASQQDSEIVIQECAILFESGFNDTVDKVIEVYAPKSLRVERAMRRDSSTIQQVEARMRQQMDEDKKRELADYCIVNDGSLDLEKQIDEIIYNIIVNDIKQ